jgi:hypothetical protein
LPPPRAIAKTFRDGFADIKAVVMLLDLTPKASEQGAMWGDVDRAQSSRLMTLLERVNAEHGEPMRHTG